MSNEDIAEALGTTFVEDNSLNEIESLEAQNENNDFSLAPIQADLTLVSVSAEESNFDNEESVYIRTKLRTVSEVASQFFDAVAHEYQIAPTAKMAESAGKILDTQVSALNKLADMDENRKKRMAKVQLAAPKMNAAGDINVTNNTIITSREDLLKVIKSQKMNDFIDAEEVKNEI